MSFISIEKTKDGHSTSEWSTIESWEAFVVEAAEWAHLFTANGYEVRHFQEGSPMYHVHSVPMRSNDEYLRQLQKEREWERMPWYRKMWRNRYDYIYGVGK